MTNTINKTKPVNKVNSHKYIVTRDGFRVSELEYNNPENAIDEYTYWKSLTQKWDKSSTVEIVEKNLRKD